MQNKIKQIKTAVKNIKTSWTYNHKREIVIMALSLVVVAQSHYGQYVHEKLVQTAYALEDIYSYNYEYVREQSDDEKKLEERINARAQELFEARKALYLESLRQEAIKEESERLIQLTKDSPYVDYDELQAKFGY